MTERFALRHGLASLAVGAAMLIMPQLPAATVAGLPIPELPALPTQPAAIGTGIPGGLPAGPGVSIPNGANGSGLPGTEAGTGVPAIDQSVGIAGSAIPGLGSNLGVPLPSIPGLP